MHPALVQQDILRLVFESIRNYSPKKIAILNISLACHAFKEPALDTLWHELHSLAPLLNLVLVTQKADGTYELPDDITPNDLERFKYYARRVKKLVYRKYRQKDASQLPILARLPDILDGPVLPCLRTMQWFVAEQGGPLSHTLIAHPVATLRSITIQFDVIRSLSIATDFAKIGVAHFVQTLATNAPWLTQLLLVDLPESFALSFSQFTCLKSLTFTHQIRGYSHGSKFMTPQHFASMSTIMGLTCLKLDLHEFSAPNLATCQFHSLSSVHLIGNSDAVVSVIPSLRPSPITVFSVKLVGDYAALDSLFNSITFQTLECLTIDYSPYDSSTWKGCDLLPSLLTCTKLTKCNIHLNDVIIALTEDDIFSMACCWPLIEELKWKCDADPSPSVLSLEAFVEHLSRLRILGISVYIQSVNIGNAYYEDLPVSNHKLQKIEIYKPLIEDRVIDWAHWLLFFFPYLEEVSGSGDEDDEVWRVAGALRKLQFIKKLWAQQAARESGSKGI
ncbi:hypothetical protein OE88DRAFT_853020 [Heliocybe sulcata]|uniref:F-box domain-containing protein n=1 Tax=Heliocybe sulcata TaxID=5364 RepID=A0A5C3MZ20_9AGAM|nr:hypothetical protein OE88DRAFT_853020 [Heliocybe sulcata]